MIKKLTAAVFALSMAFPSIADVLQVRQDAPDEYVVQEGDTLWDISSIYLDQPWLWPQLWRLNPQIDNPHLIYPGDKLSLVYDEEGRPMLVMNQKYKKLSPTIRKTMKKSDAVPTLPLEIIRPYLTYEQALSNEYILQQPVVLGANETVKNFQSDHIVYVKGDLERSRFYGVYRKGDAYVDPTTEEVLAHEAILVGTAKAFRTGDMENAVAASARLKNVKREVKQGDFLLPAFEGQSLPAFFTLTRPETEVNGTIIASANKLREFSKLDVVIINKGKFDSLKPGNILDISRTSPTVIVSESGAKYQEDASRYEKTFDGSWLGNEDQTSKTWKMPAEKVGELMVFKVYDKVSYALVVKTLRPIRVGDEVNVNL